MSDFDIDDTLPELWWYGALDETETLNIAPGQANLSQLLQAIISGTPGDVKKALGIIAALRPSEMIQPLLQVANGRGVNEITRKRTALYAVGLIGGQPAVHALVDFKPALELKPAWCHAMGLTRTSAALPALMKTLNDGMSIAVWTSSSLHEQYAYGFLARGYTLLSVGRIGDPGAIRSLVEGASREWLATEYHETEENLLSNSSNLGLALLGAGLSAWQEKKKTAMAAAVIVNPSLSIQFMTSMMPDVKRAWMLNLRIGMLRWLAHKNGTGALAACRSIARDNTQALMVALPMLFFEIDRAWLDILAKATKSMVKIERILAFDGWVRAAVKYPDPSFIEWVQLGLKDKDSLVRSAVAASVLMNHLTELEPQVLRFTQSQSTDARISLLPALAEAAFLRPGSQAQSALQQVALNDPDKNVRAMAGEFVHNLEQARIERERLVQDWTMMLDAQYPLHDTRQSTAAAKSSEIPQLQRVISPAQHEQIQHCLFCGKGIPHGAMFCPYCGKNQAG